MYEIANLNDTIIKRKQLKIAQLKETFASGNPKYTCRLRSKLRSASSVTGLSPEKDESFQKTLT